MNNLPTKAAPWSTAKKVVNAITISRFFAAVLLLVFSPAAALFYVAYSYCVFSDIADGFIARKTKSTSNIGAILDSAADLFFIAIALIVLIPFWSELWQLWMILIIAAVLFTRILALGIGFVKYRSLSLLHTYANKGSGLVLAAIPLMVILLGLPVTIVIAGTAAGFAALEELFITIRAKKLNRNIVSFLNIQNTNGEVR